MAHQELHNLVQKLSHETLPQKNKNPGHKCTREENDDHLLSIYEVFFAIFFRLIKLSKVEKNSKPGFALRFKRFFDDAVIHQKRKSCPSGGPRQRPADMHFTFIGAALIHWKKRDYSKVYAMWSVPRAFYTLLCIVLANKLLYPHLRRRTRTHEYDGLEIE